MSVPYRHREGSNVWEAESEGRTSGDEASRQQSFGVGGSDEDDDDVDRHKGPNTA